MLWVSNADGRLSASHRREIFGNVGRSDGGGDPLLELLLRRGADLARGHLAVLEDHQGRDRHDAVFRRHARVLVDVELHNLDLVAHGAGDFLERRRDHAARAAPLGPEVDNDRAGRLEHLGLEVRVGHFANGHGSPRYFESGIAYPGKARNVWTLRWSVKAHHGVVRAARAASSASAGISPRAGTSVHTKAARMGRFG